jgi:hypothetical protein
VSWDLAKPDATHLRKSSIEREVEYRPRHIALMTVKLTTADADGGCPHRQHGCAVETLRCPRFLGAFRFALAVIHIEDDGP